MYKVVITLRNGETCNLFVETLREAIKEANSIITSSCGFVDRSLPDGLYHCVAIDEMQIEKAKEGEKGEDTLYGWSPWL